MIRSLYTAATGMKSQQMNVDNISNNLANVNTVGFKKSKLEFQDLLYQTIKDPGSKTSEFTQTPVGLQVGLGVESVANHKIFGQGSFLQTGNSLDMAVDGEGFFQVLRPDGSIGYTRDGSFKVSSDGRVVTSEGFALEPEIIIPEDASNIVITAYGTVEAVIGNNKEAEQIGQIELARFVNPSGLRSIGGNIYESTMASGQPVVNSPATDKMGNVKQGYLESSNVEVVEEMVGLITAQRAYEITSKAIQTSEEMLQVANQIKR